MRNGASESESSTCSHIGLETLIVEQVFSTFIAGTTRFADRDVKPESDSPLLEEGKYDRIEESPCLLQRCENSKFEASIEYPSSWLGNRSCFLLVAAS